MKQKKYLVTGGMGFIGRALVRRLVRDGHSVRVLDNQSRGTLDDLREIQGQFEFVKGDIRDLTHVLKAVQGMERIFHLAFINGTEFFYTKPELVLEVGVKGMMNILDACLKENIAELFLASSSEVYQYPSRIPTDETAPLLIPDPFNPRYSYAGAKIINELLAIHYGRKYFKRVVIFRPHNVYGPDMGWEHVIPQFVLRLREICLQNQDNTIDFPIQGSGKETRAFCFIDDFIDGLMLLNDKGEHENIYHIGTDEELPISKVAEAVGRYFSRQIRLLPSEVMPGSTPRRCPDIAKMVALGYRPKVSFERGLELTARWYDHHAHQAPAISHSE